MLTDDSLHQHVRTSLLPCGLFFLTLKKLPHEHATGSGYLPSGQCQNHCLPINMQAGSSKSYWECF